MDVVMEIETEPRSSLERALMERDREGQLYLETRRQRAVGDLLDINRTSFLSTITPPSTNPPSAASSLFQEPLTTPTPTDATARPSIPDMPIQSDERPSAAAAAVSAINTPPSKTPLTTVAIQNIIPTIKKKTRRKSSPGRGRTLVPELENRPVVSISTSSLEYQLTANLLKFHHVPTSSSGTRSRSRSRSKPRLHKSRHTTLSNDAKIDTNALTMTSRGTGHARAKETTQEQEKLDDLDERTGASTSVAKPSPAWNSIPSSPTSMFDSSSPVFPSSSSSEQHYSLSAPLNTLRPSSPPLPPLPPKSPRSLIAHYFPGSLPPPPARCRPLHVQKNHVLAPRPFKTPTFGPVFTRPIGAAAAAAPPMPSPSSSFHYITTLPSPTAMDDSVSFSSPSPSISLGPALSVTSIQQPQVPSDLDLSTSTSAHARSHHHHQQAYQLPLHSNNSNMSAERGRGLASFSSLADSEALGGARLNNNNNNNNYNNNNNNISSTKATLATSSVIPIYPRDLMPIAGANTSGNSSSSNSNSLHSGGPQKIKPAVPYIRELVPGREDAPTPSGSYHNDNNAAELPTTTSPNTSRDLELILEEITGRIYTNRTSTGPWSAPLPSCYLHDLPEVPGMDHPGDEKSLPPIRREKGSRYWVFRTAEGEIVPGPYLFLLGHLCPILWWVGSVYPAIEHPDHRHPQHHRHRYHRHHHYHETKQPQQRALAFPRSGKNSIASVGSERRLFGDEDPTMRMSMVAQAEAEDAEDLAENPVVQWLQRQLRAAGVRIASITTTGYCSSPFSSSSPSRPQTTDPEEMATLQVVRISQDDQNRDAELPGAGLAGNMNNNSSWIHVPARLLFPPLSTTGTPHAAGAAAVAHAHQVPTAMVEDTLDTHGPWSAEDNDAYLFELRMERDRKLLRYELDLSWRRINLIWSLGSFVLALTITALVLTAT